MSSAGTRKQLLEDFGQALVLVLVVTVLVCVTLGIASAWSRSGRRDDWRDARQRVQFYELVDAGGTNSQTVDARLAFELSERLQRGPDAIASFRGTSARFGGITDAIGFDPFQGTATCTECGALDADVQADLLLIKQGRLGDLQERVPTRAPTGVRATPFGAPVAVVLGADVLIAGAIVAVPKVMANRRKRASVAKVRRSFPDQVRVLDDIDHALDHAPDSPAATDLRGLRDSVWDYMRRQAGGDESTDDATMASMVEVARETKEFFEVRASAREELREGTSQKRDAS